MFGQSHLFMIMTIFLHCFATRMVVPAITDVTMAAVCPGKDECSLAIYLTGAQQAIIGLGSVVAMPLIGKLSDIYGRKLMLTLPLSLSIFPLVILGYKRSKYYLYASYVVKTAVGMATEGSVLFLSLAYVADNVEESRRASVFAIMSGFSSASFVLANFSSRFLSTSAIFQVSAAMSATALLYMRLFLPESVSRDSPETDCLLEKEAKWKLFDHSFEETIGLLRTSPTFSRAAVVAFSSTVANVGLYASLMYYLKAEFHFNKDEFADLMIIDGIAESISQLRSIASKQTGPSEQGKAQGCITAICSLANIVSPLAFSSLTALFISKNAHFHFPGFSILCSSFVALIALAQSIMIRPPSPPLENCSIMSKSTSV